jgi:ABC-2 type transport system ATP-binding protein
LAEPPNEPESRRNPAKSAAARVPQRRGGQADASARQPLSRHDGVGVIEARGLTKRFGTRTAVESLDLTARPGEIYGFLGPNGAGKTTTIRMLLGVLHPDAGTVQICGRPVRRDDRAARRLVGAVAEVQHLYADMTCQAYLRFFAALYRIDRAAHRVSEVLELVGLSDRAADLAVDLSKGLQQKLGLARALLHDPPVLVLDEPVSGLDPHGIREVREIICCERDRGRLVFLSSHVLSEIERTADRIGIMRRGRLAFEGPAAELTARYRTLEDAFVSITREVA